jgi:hypothetical protein
MYTKPSRWIAIAGALMCAASAAARAQDPVRLPGVVVKAPIEKPGPRALVGIARDTFATPIDSVEITLPDLKKRAITLGDGKFRFDQVAPGEYDVRARKIGYAPQVRTVQVDAEGGVGVFELLQLQRALPPVIVSATRGGISGVVGDTSYQAIPAALVRVAGQGRAVETDSAGYFHFDVAPGQYYLTVKDDGFKEKIVSVRVPADSGRRVSIFLEPAGGGAAREYWNIDDFNERIGKVTKSQGSIYSRDALIDMGIEWIGDAIQGGLTRVARNTMLVDKDCVAILNGGPGTVQLKQLTIDDVATIEVYPPGTSVAQRSLMMDRPQSRVVGKKGVADSRVRVPFENTARAAIQNAAMQCAEVWVWTR